ncbi:hypothetical protein [uncultured Bacteroides sp.]|uniref:hypothetical protein n=1 Tax=uncultured Bacteroides sp. TaxID=162156 RepID=UPI00280B4E5F|nr:hypothetical protein [uncultured Bacteroides sp.]
MKEPPNIRKRMEVLPEPRAQEEYLRPHCDKKKKILSYLMKIIREYRLFELEEDGYFMPKELNPLRKKDEKTRKTEEGKPVSDAKNDGKQPKRKRETPENKQKTDKNLQYNNLPKTIEVNQENIKDLKITATAKSNARCPLKPGDSIPLYSNNPAP